MDGAEPKTSCMAQRRGSSDHTGRRLPPHYANRMPFVSGLKSNRQIDLSSVVFAEFLVPSSVDGSSRSAEFYRLFHAAICSPSPSILNRLCWSRILLRLVSICEEEKNASTVERSAFATTS